MWQETYNQATDVWTGKEKSERKQHCAKAGPSLCIVLSIQSLPDLWKRRTVDFTEQQTGQAPPALSLLLHLLHLSCRLHRSSSITERGGHLHLSHLPEGLWLYGNALRRKKKDMSYKRCLHTTNKHQHCCCLSSMSGQEFESAVRYEEDGPTWRWRSELQPGV